MNDPRRLPTLPIHPVLSGIAAAAATLSMGAAALAADVAVTVRTDEVTHQVDPKVYGHFYEHIYHSANGGLWGNVVWNRSFEQSADGAGAWETDGDTLRQMSLAPNVTTSFGEQDWSDFEYTLQARKIGGTEGFLIPFRVTGERDFYWLNLGGWGNTQHAIEGADGGPKRIIGSPVPGQIEEGRWYDLRLRVEGDHLQVWVDGEKLFDQSLGEDQTPRGRVGLGTWVTRAEFRNLRVTDLSGNEQWSGLPTLPTNTALAANWQVVEGQARLTPENPLNDEVAATLKAGAVIQQPHVKFDAEDPLSGSLWARGEATVTVQAVGPEGTVLATQDVEVSGDWAEYDVRLAPSADAGEGVLRLSTDQEVTLDQVNLLPRSAQENDGFRVDLYEALAGLQPTIIRWPGGIYAEQYDWTMGVGPQHERRKNFVPLWEDYDPNSLGTNEFMTLCAKLDAEPLLVINTGMHVTGTSSPEEWEPWLQSALNWIEYCNGDASTEFGALRAKHGHPEPYNVVYWEIDNELWRSRQTSPQVYAEAVNYFAPAMRAKGRELGTELIILAHGGNGADRDYNQVLLDKSAEHFDILSIHHYMDPRRFDDGVAEQESLYEDMRQRVKESANPDIELYVSEWNAQSTDWRTGLYAGGLLNAFERQGDFLTIGGPALLLREHTAGAWDNAFINFKQDTWYPAPNYVVMKLWREHFAPDFLALDGDLHGTNLVATKSQDGSVLYLKAVNPTEEQATVAVTLDGAFTPGEARMQQVAPGDLDARNTFEQPQAVKPEAAPASVEGKVVRFDLPPHSAGVVTVQAAD